LTKEEERRSSSSGEEGTPMLSVVTNGDAREDAASMLDEICRHGARQMLAIAL
jgi:hypothetical protein